MNPSFRKAEHVLSLDLYNRQPDLECAIATAGYYHIDSSRARKIVRQMQWAEIHKYRMVREIGEG